MSVGEACGRLLAVVDHTRELALGRKYRGLKPTEFQGAMLLPARRMPGLLAECHRLLPTLNTEDGQRVARAVEDHMATIGEWPERLGTDGQAEFGVGFHVERGELRRPEDPEPGTEVTGLVEALDGLAPRDRLATLALLPPVLEVAMARAVAELRGQQVSWDEIGRLLGASRQAAQQRFSP